MPLFAKKLSLDEVQRQAAEELDSAVARAKPPTESERTWALPLPEIPDLRPPRRSPSGRRARLVWEDVPDEAEAVEDVDEVEAPAPARRKAAPATPKATRRTPPPTAKTTRRTPPPAAKATATRRAPAPGTKTVKTTKTASRTKAQAAPATTRARRTP